MEKNGVLMTEGALTPKIFMFAIPLMLSGILQLLFNAADIVVVGQFAGYQSMAAVGATSTLANLIFNLFMGLSVGVSVVVAQCFGAEDHKGVSETVHTAISISLISGLIIAVVGVFIARPVLIAMNTPVEILDKAVLYLQIYFIGAPASMLYNFGAAILRAVGNTKQPLYYLTFAGVFNVVLNLLFVIVLKMDVAGVALATIISQAISAVLVMLRLMHAEDCLHFDMHSLCLKKDKLLRILKIGIPSSVSSVMFSLSNITIQSSLNSFNSSACLAGNTASGNLEGFIFAAMSAFEQAALTFASHHVGAGKINRIRRVLLLCVVWVTVVALVLGVIVSLLGQPLLSLYNQDATVIFFGQVRLIIIALFYFICGIMNVLVGVLRGIGGVLWTTIITTVGTIGFRYIWVYTIFADSFKTFTQTGTTESMVGSLRILYLSYPISWVMIIAFLVVYFLYLFPKVKRQSLKSKV